MSKTKAPWVVIASPTACCQRCGRELEIKLPCRIDEWLGIARVFLNVHAKCQEKPTEPTA